MIKNYLPHQLFRWQRAAVHHAGVEIGCDVLSGDRPERQRTADRPLYEPCGRSRPADTYFARVRLPLHRRDESVARPLRLALDSAPPRGEDVLKARGGNIDGGGSGYAPDEQRHGGQPEFLGRAEDIQAGLWSARDELERNIAENAREDRARGERSREKAGEGRSRAAREYKRPPFFHGVPFREQKRLEPCRRRILAGKGLD